MSHVQARESFKGINSNMKIVADCGIRFYQKFLSPFKGFRCAFGTYYNGDSCSEIIRKEIMKQGVFQSLSIAKEQFLKCKEAKASIEQRRLKHEKGVRRYSKLDENGGSDSGNLKGKRKRFNKDECVCDGISAVCDAVSCADISGISDFDCDFLSFIPDIDCC